MIRADPDRAGLLYAGTENGVYVSFDDGASWRSLQLSLPLVPITDLAVKEGDLVAATQGRGYWILDDLSPLHQLEPSLAEAPVHLFTPRPAYRLEGRSGRDEPVDMGKNPPQGVVFHFLLAEEPAAEVEVKLEILEADGEPIRVYTRKPKPGEDDEEDEDSDAADDPRQLEAEKGANRFVWDLRYPSARRFPKLVLWNRRLDGPRAVPGEYRARLTVGEESAEASFEILPDPRTSATAEDFAAQFDFLIEVRDSLSEVHDEIGRLRDARGQIEALAERLGETPGTEVLVEAGETLAEKLTGIEEALYQTKNRSRQDPLNYPIRLNDKLAGLLGLAGVGDKRPTAQMLAVKAELSAAIDAELEKLEELWENDLPALNDLAREHEIDRVILQAAE